MEMKFKRLLTMGLATILVVSACVFVVPQSGMKVKAASNDKNLQLGTDALNDNVNTTSAPVVYYDSNKDTWKVVGYDGTGVASSSGTITLIAPGNMANGYYDDTTPYSNNYSESNLQSMINGIAGRLTTGENGAVALKTLIGGNPNYNESGHNENDISGATVSNATMWPLSVAEANQLNADLRALDTANTNWILYHWWLRSPGDNAFSSVAYVDGYGVAVVSGIAGAEFQCGVRPAFNSILSSIIFTSAATGGKSSSGIGAAALTALSAYDGSSGWKLTALDSTRSFSASRADTAAVPPEDTLVIDYTGATVGTNEFISAILLDSTGELLYYGRVQSKASGNADDSALVTIPAGLADGYYTLKVFSEQYNGDQLTDLASAFSTINFTVDATAPRTYTLPVPPTTPGPVIITADEAGNEEPSASTKKDWLEILNETIDEAINEAIKEGTPQTIYLKGVTGLPITLMRKLKDNPQITLDMSYSYEGVDYHAVVPGKSVIVDDTIPWYGPLYLNKYYSR
ncbi:MAG: hypothetical protein J6Z09_02625 [Lachnospiraceae bacterium]|nr:hypothetical protein [Lachnospiraceae bacterium]